MQKLMEEKRAAAEEERKQQEAAEKEKQKEIGIQYRASIKTLIELCKEKMPGTNYDRFYVESIKVRIRTIDKVEPIIEFLKGQEQGCADAFGKFMDTYFLTEEERVKV